VFEGPRMVRGYYRRLQVPSDAYPDAEREVAEDVARMAEPLRKNNYGRYLLQILQERVPRSTP